jgi:DtxR family Mn-dependent transcriptional regulator
MTTTVASCHGGSPASALAEAAAAELVGLGASVEGTIALDGCASGCCSLALAARGETPRAVFDVSRYRGAPAAIAREIAALLDTPPPTRRPRVPRRDAGLASERRHTADDYLLAIELLGSAPADCGSIVDGVPVIAADLARALGVSRPTVGEMLARLEQDGIVERTDGRHLVLTAAGRERAAAVVRKQRILEVFAVRTLGVQLEDAFDRARALGEGFDNDALTRLHRALDAPGRCPHGWPLDVGEARRESRELVAALSGPAGATVVAVVEADREALRALAAAGVAPGTPLPAGVPAHVRNCAFVRAAG